MNRKTLFFLTLLLFSTANTFAQDCDYSGTAGKLQWCLKNGTFTISGNGEMQGYMFDWEKPWNEYSGSIQTVIVETGITSIGENFFRWCVNLTTVIIPDGVTGIGAGAFAACRSLTSINIPNGVTSIGATAFGSCENLTSINIPNSVTHIGCCVFNGCINLTSITIPEGVTSIESHTFYFCKKLSSVTIPCSVTNIDQFAFMDCPALTSFTYLNPVPADIYIGVFLFTDISRCTLRVPMGSVDAYKNHEIWKYFGKIVGIDVSIETIESKVVKIYPNPTSGELKIEGGELKIEDIAIYDVFGKIQKVETRKLENTIDLSHLPAGLYFVRITTEAGEVIKKVVKQ